MPSYDDGYSRFQKIQQKGCSSTVTALEHAEIPPWPQLRENKMDPNTEIIDLCGKTVKSEDTAITIPLDSDGCLANAVLKNEESDIKPNYTEQWVTSQALRAESMLSDADHEMDRRLYENEQPVPADEVPHAHHPLHQNEIKAELGRRLYFNDTLLNEAAACSNYNRNATSIPPEVAELVNKECVSKLINHLVIYAITKFTGTNLLAVMHSVTPDIDPQIHYRTGGAFVLVYERCHVLFYEALTELTEIFKQFSPATQDFVILWLYDMVENMCRAYAVDGTLFRREKFIEKLISDFHRCQQQRPLVGNVFYQAYQKTLPTPLSANNQSTQPKKTRKPRAKKPVTPKTKKNN